MTMETRERKIIRDTYDCKHYEILLTKDGEALNG